MKAKIALISTGGTIASVVDKNGEYKSGELAIKEILPQSLLQNVDIIELFSVDSSDMTRKRLLALAKTIEKTAKNDKYKAIIVTHGTDSMSESAFFAYLTHKSDKPLIFTGAMRSSNAKDFDGVDNFQLALKACDGKKGVFIAMGGEFICASKAVKFNANDIKAFSYKKSPNISQGFFDIPKKLPKAIILYSFAGDDAKCAKADIVVYAGLGAGTMPQSAKKNLAKLAKQKSIIVRSSVCASGYVAPKSEDEELGFIACGYFNPFQARILAMLSEQNSKEIFIKYAHEI